jgi:hypothetical protein
MNPRRAGAEPPNVPTVIGVVTRDRPECLARCVESYLANARRYGHEVELVVVDGSSHAAGRAVCREQVRALAARHGVPAWYAGLDEKRAFAGALAGRGLPEDVLRFALLGPLDGAVSTGSNRNALLLHAAGDPLLSADDDTVCRTAVGPGHDDGLALGAAADPIDTWFFPDRASLLAEVSFVERDLLGAHGALLGRSPAGCAASRPPGRADIDMVDADFLRGLEAGDGRVLATHTGLAGDCSWYVFKRYLLLKRESHRRLVQSEEWYRAVRAGRQVLRTASRTVVTRQPVFFMALSVGLDNRELLPPFVPSGRNQDAIFEWTIAACLGDGYFAQMPLAILHDPAGTRAWRPVEAVRRWEAFSAITWLVRTFEPGGRSSPPEERLRRLGRRLVEVGSLEMGDFEAVLRGLLLRDVRSEIAFLELQLLTVADAPRCWRDDAERYLAARYRLLEAAGGLERGPGGADLVYEGIAETRELVSRFGALLTWWPEVSDAARRLRREGVRLAAPVAR